MVLAGRGSQVCDGGGVAFLKREELARERSCAPKPSLSPPEEKFLLFHSSQRKTRSQASSCPSPPRDGGLADGRHPSTGASKQPASPQRVTRAALCQGVQSPGPQLGTGHGPTRKGRVSSRLFTPEGSLTRGQRRPEGRVAREVELRRTSSLAVSLPGSAPKSARCKAKK